MELLNKNIGKKLLNHDVEAVANAMAWGDRLSQSSNFGSGGTSGLPLGAGHFNSI